MSFAATLHSSRRDSPPGDLAIWIFILAELAAFGVLFIVYAVTRAGDVALFDHYQRTLNQQAGLANTVILLTSSYCVARAVHTVRAAAHPAAWRWLLGALFLGACFLLVKGWEFHTHFAAGVTLSSNRFYMFYLGLTGFHFMHVVQGMVILVAVTLKTRRGGYNPQECNGLESGAAYWHMVDLVWLILFPLVYVMH